MFVAVLPSPGIVAREQFGALLNLRGLHGHAVEVGTHRGEFARALLDGWDAPGTLHCVDPWRPMADYVDPIGARSAEERDADLDECLERLRPRMEDGRVRILRMTSAEAAPAFADESLDLVYIDGNHAREHVAADLRLWYPKVRPGAILAGHDFNGCWEANVRLAVEEFAAPLHQTVYYVLGVAASWYILKAC